MKRESSGRAGRAARRGAWRWQHPPRPRPVLVGLILWCLVTAGSLIAVGVYIYRLGRV